MRVVSNVFCFGILAGSLCAFGHGQTPKPAGGEAAPPSTPQVPAQVSPAAPPAAPTPAQGLPAPSADVSPNYILGTDDSILISVWKEPTLSGPLLVRPDGKVSLPLIGDLQATGLTPMALATAISDRLKKFINDPLVTVTVTAANSKRIFFIGEVSHPGPLSLTRDMTMLQAISAAGGLTPYANKHIYILRGEQGKQQRIPFDYKKAVKEGNQQGVTLIPGDTVVVP